MSRSILAIFLGWAASLVVIVLVEAASHQLFPLPSGSDIWNPADLARNGPAVPTAALALVAVAWALGALAGGFLAGRLVPKGQVRHALLVAAVVLGSAVWTMLTIPHPAWMWIAALLLVPAGGWLGGRLAAGMARVGVGG
ncbi:MAG TPA: hypothetical protein VFL88_03315 [Gemmatimonadales bacterium]|jgi:hypothetical protein|nr:hypothetical protein [Gemmatimonadales bacterium]